MSEDEKPSTKPRLVSYRYVEPPPEEASKATSTAEETQEVPRNFAELLYAIARPLAPILFLASIGILFFALTQGPLETTEDEGEEEVAGEEVTFFPRTNPNRLSYDVEELEREYRLREALIEERGGRAYLDGLKSKMIRGTIRFDERENDFVIQIMKPDLVVLRILSEDEQLRWGYDGRNFWKILTPTNGLPQSLEISPVERDMVQILGRLHGPLLEPFLQGRGRVALVDEVSNSYDDAIRITFTATGGGAIQEVDLDRTDLSLLRWERESKEGTVQILRLEDYRDFDDIRHAGNMTFWEDGEQQFEIEIEEVKFNFGATRFLFENPLSP